MKKFIVTQLFMSLITLFAFGQQRQVTGTIRDNDGVAVEGASVIEKGLANGTSTASDGRFRLTLRGSGNVLVVSAIGFGTKEININNQATLNVSLNREEGKSGLNEVVVVGYGRQKKITLTGAVSSISGDEIRQNPAASLQNTLAGKMPGFFSQQQSGRPGSDGAAFFIRGQSSYNGGSSQPLIIVDDIEYSYDQFSRIDANEIESLSILKDASTTAVYGVKGANGVMVVTTRRGKIGPPKISFRLENSIMQPTKVPDFLDAYESAKLYNQALLNDNPNATPRFTDADLELFKNGNDPYGHPNIDWKEVLFRKWSRQTKGNVDITGGTDKVKYFVQVGYLFQDGILKNYSKGQDVNGNYFHKRYNYRSNLDIKVTNTTDLRIDLYGNVGEVNNPNTNGPFGRDDIFYEYSSFLSLSPFAYPIYNPDGTYGYSSWQRNEAGGGNYNVNNVVGRLTYYGYNRDVENNMNFITSANQKLDFITKGLSAKATVAYVSNYGYNRGMERDQFPSFIYNPTTQTYEPRDANIYRVRRFFLGYNAGSTLRTLNLQGMINYDRTFGKHHVYALALANQTSAIAQNGNATYNFVPNNFRGFTARVGYDYRQKYLFQFNGAYNGSDRFPEGQRYGKFPAVSAGWNISEEPFFKENVSFIDRLKIRGSYGVVGNDKIGSGLSYYYLQTYSTQNGPGGYQASFGYQHNATTGIAEGTLSNANVTWESEKKADLGLEVTTLNNKLNAVFEYFNNNRYDILTTRGTVSAIFGQNLPPVNLGKVNNKGYEAELNYNDQVGKNFSYNLKATYSKAKNTILFRDEPAPMYPWQATTGNSIGQILVYKWTGTFYSDQADVDKSPKPSTPARPGDLKYEDLNGDGIINEFDRAVLGYPNLPNTNFGFQFGVRVKNISLNVLFQGAKNFNVRGTAEAIRAFAANLSEIHTKSWTPALGNDAQYPILSMNGGVSDPLSYPSTFWFIPGDYIRLKTAELAYSFPKNFTQRLRVQDIRLYTNGYNLITWSKIKKRYEFDPEIASGGDRVNYPPQRMINFGLSVTF